MGRMGTACVAARHDASAEAAKLAVLFRAVATAGGTGPHESPIAEARTGGDLQTAEFTHLQ